MVDKDITKGKFIENALSSSLKVNLTSNLESVVLDNDEHINERLNCLGNNQLVVFPSGDLYIDNPLIFNDLKNVHLIGSVNDNKIFTNIYFNNTNSLFEIINSENISFRNLNLIGPHSYLKESVGITFKHCKGMQINCCNLKNFGRSGVEFYHSDGSVENSVISGSLMKDTSGWKNDLGTRKNMGYGVNVNSSQVIVSNSILEKCSHAIASSGDGVDYQFLRNLVRNCGLNLSSDEELGLNGHSIDTHVNHVGVFYIIGNVIYQGNLGIWLRGGNGLVENNHFIDCNEGVRVGPTYTEHKLLVGLGKTIEKQSVDFLRNYFGGLSEDKQITWVDYGR